MSIMTHLSEGYNEEEVPVEEVEKTLRESEGYIDEHELLEQTETEDRDLQLSDIRDAIVGLNRMYQNGNLEDFSKRSMVEYSNWEEAFDQAYAANGEEVDWTEEMTINAETEYHLPKQSAEEIERKYGST